MKLNCRQGISLLTSFMIVTAAASYPVHAEDENNENNILEKIVFQGGDEETAETENWLSVAAEVMQYYAEKSAGLEPLVTERNWRFYDVIADKVIDLNDVSYFLELYAVLGSGQEFEGYIPQRNGEYSPVTGLTTTVPETTTTTAETTTSASTTTTTTTETTTSAVTTTEAVTTTSSAAATTSHTTTETSYVTSTVTTTVSTGSGTSISTTVSETATTVSESATDEVTTTTTIVTRPPLYNGIDVSVYQGNVDWQAVKDSGVDFAIIRAGYGKHANQEDRYFDINMKNAKAAGIDCGAYWFSYATTPEDAEKEAEAFYEVIKDYKFEYPIFFDYETNEQWKLEPEENTAIIHAFCDKMESYGYYISLYSYVGLLNYRIEEEIFECFDTWIAHFDVVVPWYSRDYGIWQYSSTGEIPGISTPVDLNYAYYDYPKIMNECHLNGY